MRTRVFGVRADASRRQRRSLAGAVCALLAMAVAACAPAGPDAPGQQLAAIGPVPPHLPHPALTDAAFTTTDDKVLPLRRWLPDGGAPPRAVILALHGFNDYSNAFDAPAREWTKDGIATYAYDQRGFGGAPGTRTLWPAGQRGARHRRGDCGDLAAREISPHPTLFARREHGRRGRGPCCDRRHRHPPGRGGWGDPLSCAGGVDARIDAVSPAPCGYGPGCACFPDGC